MNRYHKAAERITRETGLPTEWNEMNREYIVDTHLAGNTAREAEKKARELLRRYGRSK